MIGVIRNEQKRRASQLENEDPRYAYDQWLFTDEPFINDLCLMLLVTLRHQVEKELVSLAALAMNNGREIDSQQYWDNVKKLKKRNTWDWENINNRIKPKLASEHAHVNTLRLLANSYKHDPSSEPSIDLLKSLGLDIGANYASLAESDALRTKLAESINLDKEADYCDIVERFIVIASDYIENIRNRTKLSPIKRRPVSLNPKDFAQ